jgi:hypothetical protein
MNPPPFRPGSDTRLSRLRRLAHWLDDGIGIPGTRFRLGADPLFGLVPVIGDLLGAIFGAWIVLQGGQMGIPLPTLLRLIWNLALDAILGSVPLIGDVYDAIAKANLKNVALIERALADPHVARRSDRGYLLAVLAILTGLCLVLLTLSILAVRWMIALMALVIHWARG